MLFASPEQKKEFYRVEHESDTPHFRAEYSGGMRHDSANVVEKHEFFGISFQRDINNNQLTKSSKKTGSKENSQEDLSELNVDVNSRLLDKSGIFSNQTPEYGKNSSSNRESANEQNSGSGLEKSANTYNQIKSHYNLTESESQRHSSADFNTSKQGMAEITLSMSQDILD